MSRPGFPAILRMTLTAIYTFIAVLIQCSVFPHLRIFGVIPEFTLMVIVCVACREDEKFTSVLAVCAGFLLDTVGSGGFTLSPLLFLLAAAVSIAIKDAFRNKFAPSLISEAAALTAGAVKTLVLLCIKGAPFAAALAGTVLPQMLYGAIVFFPAYLLTALHYTVFRKSLAQKTGIRGVLNER
jgi:rod shape-determining protein MreD